MLTEEQVKAMIDGALGESLGAQISAALEKSLPNVVNSAVTSHMKRIDFAKLAGAEVAKAIEPFKASIEKPADPDAPGPDGGKVDPKFAKLEAKLAELTAASALKDEETKKIREGARLKDAEAQLRQALAGKVRPEAIGLAIDALRARGAIAFGEDDSPLLRLPFSAMKGGKLEPTDFTIDEGLEQFMKSPEAAVLLPAPSAGGTGQPRTTPGAGGKVRFDKSKPLSQWTQEERQAYLAERQGVVSEAMRANPLG